MKTTIKPPLALHELGKRKNQEDSIYPKFKEISEKLIIGNEKLLNNLFIVCDGVGGHNKGEIASRLACREFSKNLSAFTKPDSVSNQKNIIQAFDATQNAFDKYIAENPDSKGMATTLVAVHIHEQGLSVIHCGDSRFYHIRSGEILWQTQDHSVINELIKAGVMTEEEAKGSKRNKISRAIQGNSVKKTKPDIHFIKDLQKDDYLFLCSDGVSGSITDSELCDILSGEETNAEKMQTINTLCEANSADNYSAFLIQIEIVNSEKLKENKKAKYELNTNEKGFFDNIKLKINNFLKK